MLIKLVLASLWSRWSMALLTCLSIAISFFVLIGVEHTRQQVEENFQRTVSGVDLIVGSRTSSINLLLYSVFKMGQPADNVSWHTFNEIKQDKRVKWAVPLSMGDSHQGFAVIGTNQDYFEFFKYGNKQALAFESGQAFNDMFEVVLGADVAKKLGYRLSDSLVLSHGLGKVSFSHHESHPFSVIGILKPTGTPVDQSLYIPINSLDTIHGHTHVHSHDETPSAHAEHAAKMSAFLLGSKNKISILTLQRSINQFSTEPLTAIIPGMALRELWQIVAVIENVFIVISWLVLLIALTCLITMLLASMQEREKELSVLRALGAKPIIIVLLLELEAIILTIIGAGLGVLILLLVLALAGPWLEQEYGVYISTMVPYQTIRGSLLGAILAAGMLALIPALVAFKKSLAVGLSR